MIECFKGFNGLRMTRFVSLHDPIRLANGCTILPSFDYPGKYIGTWPDGTTIRDGNSEAASYFDSIEEARQLLSEVI